MTRSLRLEGGAIALLLLLLPLAAAAKPPKEGGGGCTSTGTERRVGTDDRGKRISCLWDTCVKTVCIEVDDRIRCGDETSYSNPRDCEPAPQAGTTRPGPALSTPPARVLEGR